MKAFHLPITFTENTTFNSLFVTSANIKLSGNLHKVVSEVYSQNQAHDQQNIHFLLSFVCQKSKFK